MTIYEVIYFKFESEGNNRAALDVQLLLLLMYGQRFEDNSLHLQGLRI